MTDTIEDKVIALAEEGVLTWQEIAEECLSCMSREQVREMAYCLPFDVIEDKEDDDDV